MQVVVVEIDADDVGSRREHARHAVDGLRHNGHDGSSQLQIEIDRVAGQVVRGGVDGAGLQFEPRGVFDSGQTLGRSVLTDQVHAIQIVLQRRGEAEHDDAIVVAKA